MWSAEVTEQELRLGRMQAPVLAPLTLFLLPTGGDKLLDGLVIY